jgi:hypothetical protein
VEQSYSGSGDFGYQIFTGLDYKLSTKGQLQLELRYGSISDIQLKSEIGIGTINNIDYKTTTAQFGLVYMF